MSDDVFAKEQTFSPISLLGQGTFFQLLARVSMVLSNSAMHLILGRMLGPARYGLIGTVLSVLTIQRTAVVNVSRQVISKYVAEANVSVDTVRRWAVIVQSSLTLSLALIYFLLADVLARLLGDSRLGFYFRVSAPFLPLVGWYAIQLATLNGIKCFVEQSLTIIIYNVVRLVSALGFIFLITAVEPETGVIWAFMLAPFIASGAAQGFYTRHRPTLGESSGAIGQRRKDIAKFVLDILFSAVALTLLMNAGQVIVKMTADDPVQVGYYTAANSVGLLPYMLLLSFADVIIPISVHSRQSTGITGVGAVVNRTWQYMLWVSLLILALVGSTATSLITWFYGSDYAPAAALLFWACAAFSLLALFVMFNNAIAAMYDSRFVLRSSLGTTIGTMLLGVFGAYWGAGKGFLIAMTACLIAVLSVYLTYLKQQGTALNLRQLGWPILCAILVAMLAALIRPKAEALIVVYVLLSIGYVAVLWLAGAINRQEKQAIVQLVKNSLRSAQKIQ